MARRDRASLMKSQNVVAEEVEQTEGNEAVTLPVFPEDEPVTDPEVEFEPEPVSVYAIADEEGKVVDLKSSIFYTPVEADKVIDKGFGDNYVHVGEYIANVLGKPLFDDNMCANFKLGSIMPLIEDGQVSYYMEERTQEEKDAELAARPLPPVQPDLGQVAEDLTTVKEETSLLTTAMFEVDNKVIETKEHVVQIEEDSALTMEAIFEVDNKAIAAQEEIKTHGTDIETVANATFELDEKVRFILEHLKLTYPPVEDGGVQQ